MPRTGEPAQRHVAAVGRAIDVLEALADGAGALGTNEIARRTGINASTVSRLLATLAAARLVEFVPVSGQYRLGLRLVELANEVLARVDVRELARPHLQALVETTAETATLSIPGEHAAITVDFVQSSSSVQSVAQIGRPSVAHATATGKVMLAFGDGELPPAPLAAYTRRTIVSHAALAKELERVRRRSWADSVGEREDDLNALAAPVHESSGGLAAIVGLQGPASRFNARARRAALPLLHEHADAISRAFGWRRPA